MAINEKYKKQAELLLRCMPTVAEESCFALKGGTAINLFIRDMPRLSVDIDLTYIPLTPREESLSGIEQGLLNIKKKLLQRMPGIEIKEKRAKTTNRLLKLFISHQKTEIKIEPNEILRGTIYPTDLRELVSIAEDCFGLYVGDVPVLSFEEVYAGKLCAALDRQHPRDLFDVMILLENEGLTNEMRKAFVVYLASGPRPMVELLDPRLIDQNVLFQDDFLGMTEHKITYNDLLDIRLHLIRLIQESLTDQEKRFLLTLKLGKPEWDLLGIAHLEKMPALRWKLLNISKMQKDKHQRAVKKLEEALKI